MLIELAYEEAEEAGLPLWCQDEAGPYQAIPQPGEDWHPEGKPTLQPHEYIRGGTAKLLTLFRPHTGEVQATGVLSAPNAVLHPWLKEHLQPLLAALDTDPLAVRVPWPDEHPLLLTWQHWWWSYERPKPAPALRLIAGLWTISRDISPIRWSAGCCNTASCRFTRRSLAPGSTWPSPCSASSCGALCPVSTHRPLNR